MKHVHISVPTRDSIKSETVGWLLQQGQTDLYTISGKIHTSDWPIDSQRNRQVKAFLEISDATHIFFLDSDVVPPGDAISNLIGYNVDVIAGVYPAVIDGHAIWSAFTKTKGGLYEPLQPEQKTGLQSVDGIGMGCCLVSRRIFEKLIPPWFITKMDKYGDIISTEDFTFCDKVKRAGFKIYVDFDVKCIHHKPLALNKEMFNIGIARV